MNILVEYDNEYKKKTNPLLLLTTEDPQLIPYLTPYTEDRYAGIKNLNHQGSVLMDSTNRPLIPASKVKNHANSSVANLLNPKTSDRTKVLTWADVACGNQVASPTQSIKAQEGLPTKMAATNAD